MNDSQSIIIYLIQYEHIELDLFYSEIGMHTKFQYTMNTDLNLAVLLSDTSFVVCKIVLKQCVALACV